MCTGKGLLAIQENFGHVAECECGTIHLSVGPLSMALDTEALRRLHGLIGEAIERMDSQELAPPQPLFLHSPHLALKKVLKIKH